MKTSKTKKNVARLWVGLLMCACGAATSASAATDARNEVPAVNPEKAHVARADDAQAAAVARAKAAVKNAEATEVVQVATDEVLALIKRGQAYAKDDPERFYTEVEEILTPFVDFDKFARSVMGVWAKRASGEQRARFADSFKWSLVRTYALALTEFNEGQVRVVPPPRQSPNPDQEAVTMEVLYQGKTYQVVYAMQRRNDEWGLVNLVIEGINLRLNYRSQFDSAMKGPKFDRDLDKVIDAWSNVIESESKA